MTSAAPLITLPPVPHWPGRTARPDEAVFRAAKDDLADRFSPSDLAASVAFQAGFEAFNAGYFWEAHELWEAVWMQLAPACRERWLLQGLIQLANAGLKHRMGRAAAVTKILPKADAALSEAFRGTGGALMGVDHRACLALRAQAASTYAI